MNIWLLYSSDKWHLLRNKCRLLRKKCHIF